MTTAILIFAALSIGASMGFCWRELVGINADIDAGAAADTSEAPR